jgi:pyrimidine operon attenuation protein / uracil phosphoribosyltransferase
MTLDGPQLLDAPTMQRTLVRLAHEIAERHPSLSGVLLAGIRTRGLPLAERIAHSLDELGHDPPAVAELDARDYRDDAPRPRPAPNGALRGGDGTAPHIDGATVIVIDDVLFTGRTVRAAMDALMHAGRPSAVEVLVLIDRGHRELPVRATYVGKNIPTALLDRVSVKVREIDGVDGAWLLRGVGV